MSQPIKAGWQEIDGELWYYRPSGTARERGRWCACKACGSRFPALNGNPGVYCSRSCWGLADGVRSPTRQDLFEQWTPEECWLAGLIWADGCLTIERPNLRRVTLMTTDLELAVHAAGIAGVGYHHRKVYGNRKAAYSVTIGGWMVMARLMALGLEPRKSFTTTMPQVPHVAAFIRGYFDGDGTTGIYRNRLCCSFVGTHRMMEQVAAAISANTGVSRKNVHRNGPTWTVSYAHQDSLRVAAFMYADDGPHLSRKKAIFDRGYLA